MPMMSWRAAPPASSANRTPTTKPWPAGIPDCFLAGEGDNRVLMRNRPDEIRSMVESMVETGRLSGGYMMCIGNHIPWNVPPEAIKRYLDLSQALATR